MIKNPRSSGLNGFYLTVDQIINISGLVIKYNREIRKACYHPKTITINLCVLGNSAWK